MDTVRMGGPARAQGDGYSRATLSGGLLAGLLASACCVGPLALVMVGVSGAWISNLTLLEPYRWIFIGVALVFMTLAWRRIYRPPAAAAQKTVVLSVPSMNCAACPITVRKALEKVDGVQSVKATLEPPEAVVTFDDATTSIEKLTEATKGAGYPSTVKSQR